MSIKGNIIKGYITSIMGVVIYIITTFFIWQRVFDFIWEGIAGYTLGTLLLLVPKSLEKAVIEAIKAWGGKNDVACRTEPSNDK